MPASAARPGGSVTQLSVTQISPADIQVFTPLRNIWLVSSAATPAVELPVITLLIVIYLREPSLELSVANPLRLPDVRVIVPVPVMVTVGRIRVERLRQRSSATLWLAFMVTVKAGVALPLPTENTAASLFTQATPVVVPPTAVYSICCFPMSGSRNRCSRCCRHRCMSRCLPGSQ